MTRVGRAAAGLLYLLGEAGTAVHLTLSDAIARSTTVPEPDRPVLRVVRSQGPSGDGDGDGDDGPGPTSALHL